MFVVATLPEAAQAAPSQLRTAGETQRLVVGVRKQKKRPPLCLKNHLAVLTHTPPLRLTGLAQELPKAKPLQCARGCAMCLLRGYTGWH